MFSTRVLSDYRRRIQPCRTKVWALPSLLWAAAHGRRSDDKRHNSLARTSGYSDLVTHIQHPGSNSDWFGPFMFDSIIARKNAQVTPKSIFGSLQKNIDCGQNGGSWHIEFHRSEGSYGTDHGQNWHPEHLQLWIPQDGFRLCCHHQIAGFPLWGVSSCLRRAVAQCALSSTTYLAQDGHRGWSRETPHREGDCRSSGRDHTCITAGQTET